MSETTFQRLLLLLSEANVEFVVIGGLAASIHGSAHITYDVDICYERSLENAEKIAKALATVKPKLRGAPSDLPFKFDSRTILSGLNFTLETTIGPIDLLGEVLPLGEYSVVAQNSELAELFGVKVKVISLEALIQAKRTAGRPKDLLVLPELEALLELKKRPLQ